jgi:hypothetical protein
MFEPVGSVDHYISWDTDHSLAYEWSNYRFAAEWINKSKQTADDQVLDPFEVQDGWFEILLPSLQLVVVTSAVPSNKRAQAEYTLERLHLRDDERVIRQREAWYRRYQENKLTLEGLEEVAPLLARAIRNNLTELRRCKECLVLLELTHMNCLTRATVSLPSIM